MTFRLSLGRIVGADQVVEPRHVLRCPHVCLGFGVDGAFFHARQRKEKSVVLHWKNNLLLGAVCILIPMIGPLLLTGWHTTCLWARGSDDDPVTAPPFDFQYFTKYLEFGVWPFLVNLTASLLFIPVTAC